VLVRSNKQYNVYKQFLVSLKAHPFEDSSIQLVIHLPASNFNRKSTTSHGCVSVIPAFKRVRQDNLALKASLGYIARLSQKVKT
jgi:hypothetical protein